ncbi:hypothetical protein [Nocardia xishanensis]
MSWSSPTSSPGDRYYTLPSAWDFADERLALLGAPMTQEVSRLRNGWV